MKLPKVEPQDYWKWNLPVLAFTTFLTVVSFSLVFPFLPLFVKELGVTDPGQAAFWSGVAGGAMGVALAVSGPVWGILGDRYGRKKNLLRAFFLGAVPMGLIGLSGNVYQLVLLRALGGLFSGSYTTALALAASQSPPQRMGFSIGVVQAGGFAGMTLGPFIGGLLGDAIGLQYVFYFSGGGLFVGGILAAILVKEEFHRPQEMASTNPREYVKGFLAMVTSKEIMPILGVMFLIQLIPSIMMPVFPLLLGELSPGESAVAIAGKAYAFMGLASVVAAVGVARISHRVGLKSLLVVCALVAGLLYLPMLVVQNATQAMALATAFSLFGAGMNSVSGALMGTAVPKEKHGRAFGVFQSVQSLAWGTGPLLGGSIATTLGLREVFPINGAALILLSFLAWRFVTLKGGGVERVGRASAHPRESLRPHGQNLR